MAGFVCASNESHNALFFRGGDLAPTVVALNVGQVTVRDPNEADAASEWRCAPLRRLIAAGIVTETAISFLLAHRGTYEAPPFQPIVERHLYYWRKSSEEDVIFLLSQSIPPRLHGPKDGVFLVQRLGIAVCFSDSGTHTESGFVLAPSGSHAVELPLDPFIATGLTTPSILENLLELEPRP